MARLLIRALRAAGHEVTVASRFRVFDGAGDADHQERLRRTGEGLARRYVARHRANPPDLWFTYHLYHKAPDWIGPRVCGAYSIPYVVAEASYAPKQADGPWDQGHRAVAAALRMAARIVCLNPEDAECIAPLVSGESLIVRIPPFVETASARSAAARRAGLRRELATEHGIDAGRPWIAVTAMMRRGDKLASYRLLGRALRKITARPWVLLVAGDGEAREEVERSLDFPGRVHYLGCMDRKPLDRLHAAADLGVWPAINEAYGMAILEAQAAGLPMVVGDRRGTRQIVVQDETGLLVPEGDADKFADAIATLLKNPMRVEEMRKAALANTATNHDLAVAARRLDGILREASGVAAGFT
jgi:glycosyltransferase involved in cell wall biosynthesis